MALPWLLERGQAAAFICNYKLAVAYTPPPGNLKSKPKRFSHPLRCSSPSFPDYFRFPTNDDPQDLSADHGVGDCLIFEEDAFDDPFLSQGASIGPNRSNSRQASRDCSNNRSKSSKLKSMKKSFRAEATATENLIPDEWTAALAEINLTKKERRQIAREIEFNSKVEKKKEAYLPLSSLDLENYQAFNEAKLAHFKPTTIHHQLSENKVDDTRTKRVPPKDPRWAVYGKGIEDVRQLFKNQDDNSPDKFRGRRKLFTNEEKALLNRKQPDLSTSTSRKWHSLHAFAASGEAPFVNLLLRYNSDINAADADGLTALHKAIISKKLAMARYLLKESANPFLLDNDGASLMHYAVQTGSISTIKLLLLYNVDINCQDKDGWTPLHLAVQAREPDVLKLLLIKGSDKTLKNAEGLTALDLCLYSGHDSGTFEMIKLLKRLPRNRKFLTS